MAKANDAAVVVFTAETKQSILNQKGSGDWVINPKNVAQCPYLVCCRRLDWKNKPEGIAHRAAFLVGRIADLQKVENSANSRGQARFRISISEFADLDIPDLWRKELRNPVAYDSLSSLGITLRRLTFQPIPGPRPVNGDVRPMTIAKAKEALAASFGVKPEDIEIIIKG